MNTTQLPCPRLPAHQIPELAIQALMKQFSFDRMVTIRHLQQRHALFGKLH